MGLQNFLNAVGLGGGSAGAVAPDDPRNPSPGLSLTTEGPERPDRLVLSDEEWRARLTPEEYRILRSHGTEAAFCSPLNKGKGDGTYFCAGCDNRLFETGAKFDSSTGWPSFFQPATPDAVWYRLDAGHGMRRTEVLCARCDGHLGHVFDDGPREKGGRRYCMNGEALRFEPKTS